MSELELMKELKNKTIETILANYGHAGDNINEIKLNLGEFRAIMYNEAKKIAQREFDNEWSHRIEIMGIGLR